MNIPSQTPSNHEDLSQNGNYIISSPTPFNNSISIKYMDCQKNHAISVGGHATDGCGGFSPGGEEGTFESLICHACNCHRNFHRRIMEQPCPNPQCCTPAPARVVQVTNNGKTRRIRTKFSKEQKENMFDFANKSGWKIQKAGDTDVESFCDEIGIKWNVLKVWMHNNKYQARKKESTSSST